MASYKTSLHVRSASLPSTSNPLDANIEDNFRRLRAFQAGSSNSSTLCQSLSNIKELYEQLKSSILLSHNQQVLSYEPGRGEVELVLDGSLALLDASSTALDSLSQMKESVQDLQSSLRRGSKEGVHVYVASRKKIIEALSKCLVNLKKVEKVSSSAQSGNSNITVTMLKEAEAISLSTLKVLLSFVIGKKAASQTRGWSLVAKLVKSKQASSDAGDCTEVEIVDHSLSSGAETKLVLQQLETLELTINELEDGLESISRCFVKLRVSLLNVLNQ